ncbi:MAG: TfoX/Sxy family protein [Deltaproteobacteria bacterium]|nr:TfoX/Sxy family protein [Deltaproteobacteria bacterium]
MAYNETIEGRIQKIVSRWDHTEAKKMFGGICHLLRGNMLGGVYKDFLILRLGVENATKAFESPLVKPFDITGKPMKGWVMVEGKGFTTDDQLKAWLNQAKEFVETLPPK